MLLQLLFLQLLLQLLSLLWLSALQPHFLLLPLGLLLLVLSLQLQLQILLPLLQFVMLLQLVLQPANSLQSPQVPSTAFGSKSL